MVIIIFFFFDGGIFMVKSSYKDVKICCYAISAGEPEEFIDRWLKSMDGADYICVLVTKEGDSNWSYFNEKRKEYGDKLIVRQKTIKPWRFDVARNESMKLIPKDSDVLICTDIDETLIEDFWDDLRKIVYEHPNFERIFYRYAWSHDDNGEPKWVFWYDKITQPKGWHWDFPVHEALRCDTDNYHYEGQYYMSDDKIYLHHYPDNTKSRGSYLGLLEMRAKEYPDDLYGLFYLAREYSFKADYVNAATTAYNLYVRLGNKECVDDMKMHPCVAIMLGDFNRRLGIPYDSEFYYRRAIDMAPQYRDGYIKLAQLLAYQPRPNEVYEILDEMEEKSKYSEDWRLTTYYWDEWKKLQIVADAKCWEQKYDEAYDIMSKAVSYITTKDAYKDAVGEGILSDIAFIEKMTGKTISFSENLIK